MKKSAFFPFLLLLFSACQKNLGFEADSSSPAVVEVFQVNQGALPRTRVFSASTMPWEMVVLSFKTSGRLVDAPFEEGDVVCRGQLVGKLDPVDQYMARMVARERLRSLQADVGRVEKLTQQGAVAGAERERILGYQEALATQLSQADIQLEATVLRAPIDGVIGKKMAQPGEMMDPAKPLGVVLVLDPIKLQIAVQERDLPLFSLNAPVRVRAGGRVVEGTVHRIASVADEATRTFTVTLRIPNPPDGPRLRVGQLAQAEVDLPPLEGVFAPAQALETGVSGSARMVGVVDGKLHSFVVQTHEREGGFTRISGDFPLPLDIVLDGFSLPDRRAVTVKASWNLQTWSQRPKWHMQEK